MKITAPLSDLTENTPCVVPSHGLLQLKTEPLTQAEKDAKGCRDLQEEGWLFYMHCVPWVKWSWCPYKALALSLTSGMPLAGEIPTGTTDASGTKAVHDLHPSLF